MDASDFLQTAGFAHRKLQGDCSTDTVQRIFKNLDIRQKKGWHQKVEEDVWALKKMEQGIT